MCKVPFNLRAEYVIRRDAGLSHVDCLSPDDSLGSDLDVDPVLNENGALPAEFEGSRSEMPENMYFSTQIKVISRFMLLVCRCSDDAAHVGAPGEEDVIELLLEELCSLGDAASDDL